MRQCSRKHGVVLCFGASAAVVFLFELVLWQELHEEAVQQASPPRARDSPRVGPSALSVLPPGGASPPRRRLLLHSAVKRGEASSPAALVANIAPAPPTVPAAASAPPPPSSERLAAARAAQAERPQGLRARVGGEAPVPPLSLPSESTNIVVMLSAFMDGERCARSMYRALLRAKNPWRLSFSVIQAREQNHPDCAGIFRDLHVPELCQDGGVLGGKYGLSVDECKRKVLNKTQAWVVGATAGKGPAHQRGLASVLLSFESEEDFCLSMDSHMDFKPNWDEMVVNDWFSTQNEFAVLSAYPADVNQLNNDGYFVDLCGYSLEGGIPRGRTGGDTPTSPRRAPYLTMNWAAGLSFHRCHMERTVPVDWHLPWVFTGEEIDRAVRLYTHGYDIYLPSNMAVLHEYAHAKQNFWSFTAPDQGKLAQNSHKRLLRLLQSQKEHRAGSIAKASKELEDPEFWGQFGLGTQRSLEDFVDWSQVDLGGTWTGFLRGGRHINWDVHNWCNTLKRRPVRDEGDLVASIGTLHNEIPRNSDGELLVPGESEDVRPRQVLP